LKGLLLFTHWNCTGYCPGFEGSGMYLTEELISKKRDGRRLKEGEIRAFVEAVSAETISDAQIAAFTMAVWFQGMDLSEQMALTLAMRDSGRVLNWNRLDGPVLDKHSSGGVGDLVSLVLGPLIAACGAYVPMISGHGLGHTGGTLDKLESIPGFNTLLGVEQFQQLVRSNGVAIIGQTPDLAPADRRFYAVRDVTATVASVPLIVASILSKKLAEGLDGLVSDIKLGSGAFMREFDESRRLAQQISRVSSKCGLPCNALITDMNSPLAWSAGNALEVREAIDFLKGTKRHERLNAVIMALASEMLVLGGLVPNRAEGRGMAAAVLDSGEAVERFSRMVAGQGGPTDLVDHYEKYLQSAPLSRPVLTDAPGIVTAIDMRSVGLAVVHLGGGRQCAEDRINPAVGMTDFCITGQKLEPDAAIATVHAACEDDWQRAAARLKAAIRIEEREIEPPPAVYERIEGAQVS
jgi:thymidine phosphorylase